MSDLERKAKELGETYTVAEFCEILATAFGIKSDAGELHLHICFRDGRYAWSKIESGRIGAEGLRRMGESAA